MSLAHPETTDLGRRFDSAASAHSGESAFRIISAGADGFAARMQMIDAAQKTLDLQYFIYRNDETGRLITGALLRAASRGVRIRLLVDDGPMLPGDEKILLLRAVPNMEVRIFNPFVQREPNRVLRSIEFAVDSQRLDYRMHNKLLVADNAVALIGGRNIADAYFQIDPDWQYADDDIFIGGPMVERLSQTFDEFWNSTLAIPAQALQRTMPSDASVQEYRKCLADEWMRVHSNDLPFMRRAESGDPLSGIVDGRLPVVWASGQVVSDSPDKKAVNDGGMIGRLIYGPVAKAADSAQSEALVITPYFVPTASELELLERMRQRGASVRVLTNSLESSDEVLAHSGYVKYREQLLREGVELHELKTLPGNARGSGQSAAMNRYGNYGLHAKFYVFDRKKLVIGSMNFDQRSVKLNTEVGMIVDSAELALETEKRFERMTEPANAYTVQFSDDTSGSPHLTWRTVEAGEPVVLTREPARNWWQRVTTELCRLLPLDREL